MRIYLDLCCLKRPFDAQDQPLIRLQTEALVSILALPEEVAEFIRSPAQALENSFNPVQARRDAVDLWLAQVPVHPVSDEVAAARIADLLEIDSRVLRPFILCPPSCSAPMSSLRSIFPF